MKFAVLIIAAYLVGSIPFAYVFAKIRGIDLRTIGSGNIGATNLSRALGKKWGYLCFILDTLKGFLPTITAVQLISAKPTIVEFACCLAVGAAAILGHIFPIYIKFKGGKGVATSFGVALGLWPYYTLTAVGAVIIWIITTLLFQYISLASIVASSAFPVILAAEIYLIPGWSFKDLWPLLIISACIPVMVIIRHKENIKRILAGTENKISLSLQFKSSKKPPKTE